MFLSPHFFTRNQLKCCDTFEPESKASMENHAESRTKVLLFFHRAIVELIKTYSNVVSWGINWFDHKLLITFPAHQTSSSLPRDSLADQFLSFFLTTIWNALTKQKQPNDMQQASKWASREKLLSLINLLVVVFQLQIRERQLRNLIFLSSLICF